MNIVVPDFQNSVDVEDMFPDEELKLDPTRSVITQSRAPSRVYGHDLLFAAWDQRQVLLRSRQICCCSRYWRWYRCEYTHTHINSLSPNHANNKLSEISNRRRKWRSHLTNTTDLIQVLCAVCINPRTRSKSNHLFLGPHPTHPQKFVKIRSYLLKKSSGQTDQRTDSKA